MVMSRSMTNMSSLSSMDYRSSTQSSTTVLRRGQPFFMAVRMKDRNFDPRRDILRASFSFGIGRHLNCANLSAYFFQFFLTGPNPQVTKGTKVVLPFRMNQREFNRAPQKWDMRLHQQEGFNITFQVSHIHIS